MKRIFSILAVFLFLWSYSDFIHYGRYVFAAERNLQHIFLFDVADILEDPFIKAFGKEKI